jgi:hypothetical protein
MAGMQDTFLRDIRETLAATRPHVDYVKDFKRRAKNDPIGNYWDSACIRLAPLLPGNHMKMLIIY